MKTKQIALLLSVMLIFGAFLAACTPSPSDAGTSPTGNVSPSAGEPDETDRSWDPTVTSVEITPVPAGAIDFSDGSTSYMAVNLSPADADPSELSIIDYNGGKALLVEVMENGIPYVGIDVSSMFGAKVSDIAKVEMRILAQHPDGKFYATSGQLETYTGTDNRRTEYLWGIAMEKNNPKTLTAELTEFFVPDAKNIMIFKKSTGGDLAVAAGEHASNLVIDYIAFYDASGNMMTADTTVDFDAPKGFGSSDRTLLYEVTDDVKLAFTDDGKDGKSSAWGQAGALDKGSLLDVALLQPGSVLTVGYRAAKAPELICQSWTEGAPQTWAKVNPFITNLSGNIAQYRYEDMVEAFGTEDFEEYLDRIYIGDRDCELELKGVSIGQRVSEIEYRPILIGDDGFLDITYMNVASGDYTPFVSTAAWKLQYRANTTVVPPGADDVGEFKPEWLVPGAFITVYYEGEDGVNFAVQKYEDKEAGTEQIWTGADPDVFKDSTLGIDQVSYEALHDKWVENGGNSDFSDLNAFWYQNRGSPVTSYYVILYTPNP